MSRVMIEPSTYESIRQAVEKAFELFPQNIAGKKVLIKPNALRASEANEAIVTNPALVRAVVETIVSMNPASLIVGDNPGLHGYGANEACFQKTGLMDAALGYYRNIGNDSRTLPFNPAYMSTVSVSEAIMDADIVISLPKFKTHGLTVLSGAIKNSYGILPGAQKAQLHKLAGSPERFHEVIVDVFKLRIPDLFIVDAVVGMEGNGPASPELRNIGLILASDNAVALDAVIATLMGCPPERLGFLKKAQEEGLGQFDLSLIDVIGDLKTIPDFKLPPLGGEGMMQNDHIQALMSQRISLRPRADAGLCTACGNCVEHCPVSALSMEGAVPVVNAGTCIVCFCCQELCPEKAITLS